jgi:cell division protein FtsX
VTIMRTSSKLLLVLLVLVLCVVGFGFYSGWFTLSSSRPGAESNRIDINLELNPDKVKADADTLKAKATELTGTASDGAQQPDDPAKDEVTSDHK